MFTNKSPAEKTKLCSVKFILCVQLDIRINFSIPLNIAKFRDMLPNMPTLFTAKCSTS